MKLIQSPYLFRSCMKPSSRSRMAQETSRPHILHLGFLVTPRLLSLSLSLCKKKPEAPTSSPPRLLRRTVCSSTPSPTGDAYLLRSLLLFSSRHFLSSILCEPDKIPTSPPLVFTGVSFHRLHHSHLRFRLFLLVSFLRHLNKTLIFDFNFQLVYWWIQLDICDSPVTTFLLHTNLPT